MPTEKNVTNLVVNKVESQEVYDYMVTNNLINDDELYFVQGGDSSGNAGNAIAYGLYSHAEGHDTLAFGEASHAEGAATNPLGTVTITGNAGVTTYTCSEDIQDYEVGEVLKYNNKYSIITAIDTANKKITVNTTLSDNEGITNASASIYCGATGMWSHTEGWGTLASNKTSHAEGYLTKSTGESAHAEGQSTKSSGYTSHAEGWLTVASGESAHAEGDSSHASGDHSHAEGSFTVASGEKSHAEGNTTNASGACSHAAGFVTTALDYQYVIGHYNRNGTAGNSSGTTGDAFIIGHGTKNSVSNAFRVTYAGKPYALSSMNTTGADYAEFFEWLDANPNNEDRRGYFVTLDGDKIKIAEPGDYILGIISALPSVVGNSDENWRGRYVLDEFGGFITEEFEYEEEIVDKETGEIKTVIKTGTRYKENPEYNPTLSYIQREDRPEWDTVGMMGVLAVRDDGTCQVNGYCQVSEGGVATASENGYRVIKRVNENVVKVVFR